MKKAWTKATLLLHNKGLAVFDAWVFHPQHTDRQHAVGNGALLISSALVSVLAITVLVHVFPMDGSTVSKWMLLWYVPLGALLAGLAHAHHFWLGVGAPYPRAMEAKDDDAGAFDALFVQCCQQLSQERRLCDLCRLEWKLAEALWNQDKQRRLTLRYYDQALPLAPTTASAPRARL